MLKIALLSMLLAVAPVTDAIEDISDFNYEDMALYLPKRRVVCARSYREWLFCKKQLPLIQPELQFLMAWVISELERIAFA